MPDEKKNPPKPPRGGGGARKDPLKEFQSAIMSFVTRVPQAALKAVGNDPDAALVEANATMIQNGFKKAFVRINQAYNSSSLIQQSEVDEFIDLADAVNMTRIGEKTAISTFSKKLFGGSFWSWLGQHLKEIKKLIGMILEIFGLKKLKDWWDKWSTFIDELFNLLVSILGSILGFNRSAIAKELSNAEVNYLNEMTALAKLQSVSRRDDGDED